MEAACSSETSISVYKVDDVRTLKTTALKFAVKIPEVVIYVLGNC
jgi:hypothetical protein